MTIAILVAMGKELNLLLPLLDNTKSETIDGFTFHSGKIGNNDIVAMQCGIGKVNAAIGTLTLLNNFKPELVINTGVAGGASQDAHVMDVIVGSSIAYHDVWCGPGTIYGEASGYPLYFESDKRFSSLIPERADIKRGLICSGDKFIASLEEVQTIQKAFPQVLAVDMESATIAQVCYLRKIPVLVMRVISDSPGASKDNTAQYNDFWQDAPAHTFNLVQELLKQI
ncbi:MAG: 5'-methylthioadenosine/adenosylhomocysteine nucleosidase [Muribaculaceae bacterium]|nr:5'-methylthioadenosine/adenosylhomocysteine nucleosidase [Muribaculaceae bacterium]MEE1297328.1 5'-methylthioadenosine/adenosylhomocysteine nucleosidase [Muribaculaceae bacterium]